MNNYPIIMLPKGLNTRDHVNKYFISQGLAVSLQIELSTMEILIDFAKRGLGISCVIKDYVQNELEQKQLYEVCTIEKIPERILEIVVNKDIPLSSAAQKFI